MSWAEHTPQQEFERDTAASPSSSDPMDRVDTSHVPADTANKQEQQAQIQFSAHTKEVHIYTYPNTQEHYPSDLSRDIAQNPTLFWGNAKF